MQIMHISICNCKIYAYYALPALQMYLSVYDPVYQHIFFYP